MASPELIQKLEKIASEVALREGCYLYDLEFVGAGKHRVLRLYIDRNETGASVDDCQTVSRGVSEVLDAQDIIPGDAYDLEVSTPGVERNLRKPEHFSAVIGKKIWIKLSKSLETFGIENKKYKTTKQTDAELESVAGSDLNLKFENEIIKIPLSAIEKAHLVFDFAGTKGEKKNLNKRG